MNVGCTILFNPILYKKFVEHHVIKLILLKISITGHFLRDWLEKHQPPCEIYKQCNLKYIGMFCALKTLLQYFKNIKPGGGGCFAPQ